MSAQYDIGPRRQAFSSNARRRYAPHALLQLAGRQRTYVAVHDTHTATARIALVVGYSVIYLAEPRTVTALDRTWRRAGEDVKAIPHLRPVFDPEPDEEHSAEPSFVVHASGNPSSGHTLIARPGQRPDNVTIRFGRIMFEVYDQLAWHSCLTSITKAKQELERGVFDQWTPGLEPVLFLAPAPPTIT